MITSTDKHTTKNVDDDDELMMMCRKCNVIAMYSEKMCVAGHFFENSWNLQQIAI